MKKSPRDSILSHYAEHGPALDCIRQALLTAQKAPRRPWYWPFRELFWPVRHAWLGIGLCWIVLLTLNFLLFPPQPKPTRNPEAFRDLASYHEQNESIYRQILALR